MADWVIVEGDDHEEERAGAFLDAHSSALGKEFVHYAFHAEEAGEVIASITAWAMGPDLHIDMLGVAEERRRSGLGGALLERVEAAGRADGCTTASVDTFSFQAPDFYPRHGYQVIFRYPLDDGTERIYFSKRL